VTCAFSSIMPRFRADQASTRNFGDLLPNIFMFLCPLYLPFRFSHCKFPFLYWWYLPHNLSLLYCNLAIQPADEMYSRSCRPRFNYFSTKKLEVHTSLTFTQILFPGLAVASHIFSLIQRPEKCRRKLKINVLNVVYIVHCKFEHTMISADFINFYFVSCRS
jgi:hypothetical protein